MALAELDQILFEQIQFSFNLGFAETIWSHYFANNHAAI